MEVEESFFGKVNQVEIGFFFWFLLQFNENLYTVPYKLSVLNIGAYRLSSRLFNHVKPLIKCVWFKDNEKFCPFPMI